MCVSTQGLSLTSYLPRLLLTYPGGKLHRKTSASTSGGILLSGDKIARLCLRRVLILMRSSSKCSTRAPSRAISSSRKAKRRSISDDAVSILESSDSRGASFERKSRRYRGPCITFQQRDSSPGKVHLAP